MSQESSGTSLSIGDLLDRQPAYFVSNDTSVVDRMTEAARLESDKRYVDAWVVGDYVSPADGGNGTLFFSQELVSKKNPEACLRIIRALAAATNVGWAERPDFCFKIDHEAYRLTPDALPNGVAVPFEIVEQGGREVVRIDSLSAMKHKADGDIEHDREYRVDVDPAILVSVVDTLLSRADVEGLDVTVSVPLQPAHGDTVQVGYADASHEDIASLLKDIAWAHANDRNEGKHNVPDITFEKVSGE